MWDIRCFEQINTHGTCNAQCSWFLNGSFLNGSFLTPHALSKTPLSQKIDRSFHLSHTVVGMVIGSPFEIAFGLVKNGIVTVEAPTVCLAVASSMFDWFGCTSVAYQNGTSATISSSLVPFYSPIHMGLAAARGRRRASRHRGSPKPWPGFSPLTR